MFGSRWPSLGKHTVLSWEAKEWQERINELNKQEKLENMREWAAVIEKENVDRLLGQAIGTEYTECFRQWDFIVYWQFFLLRWSSNNKIHFKYNSLSFILILKVLFYNYII